MRKRPGSKFTFSSLPPPSESTEEKHELPPEYEKVEDEIFGGEVLREIEPIGIKKMMGGLWESSTDKNIEEFNDWLEQYAKKSTLAPKDIYAQFKTRMTNLELKWKKKKIPTPTEKEYEWYKFVEMSSVVGMTKKISDPFIGNIYQLTKPDTLEQIYISKKNPDVNFIPIITKDQNVFNMSGLEQKYVRNDRWIKGITDLPAYMREKNADLRNISKILNTFYTAELRLAISRGFKNDQAREMAKKKMLIEKEKLLKLHNQEYPGDPEKLAQKFMGATVTRLPMPKMPPKKVPSKKTVHKKTASVPKVDIKEKEEKEEKEPEITELIKEGDTF